MIVKRIDLPTKAGQDAILSAVESVETTVENSGFLKHKKVFDVAGEHTWICPTGVETVYVSAIGGAGGGGGGGGCGYFHPTGGQYPSSGAGGGGGCIGLMINEFPVNVTPGKTYTITVGAGGKGGAGGLAGVKESINGTSGTGGLGGGASSFHNLLTVVGGGGGNGGLPGKGTTPSLPESPTPPSGAAGAKNYTLLSGTIFNIIDNAFGGNGAAGNNYGNAQSPSPGGTSFSENIFGTKSGDGGAGGYAIRAENVTAGKDGITGTSGKVIIKW
ncbi:hypothetical protein ABE042_22055 [Viridibacillus arvi]|uniref:glycine-rich domain-containing protein n=1 Tax=Viridibacillus arvi TaxID=263475 RepID=UPI003D29C332